MWYSNPVHEHKVDEVNKELLELKGDLDEKEAKISLAKFLSSNLGITTELISGIKLAPFQEITLKGMMNRNFSMCVWGRGCGKTFIASVFCFLQCIFNPGTKILIAGPTFRTASFIFNNLEKLVQSKGSGVLQQAFYETVQKKRSIRVVNKWRTITAIPLNGEKIRGFRANILLLDEFLLLT
jgi:phage terminase large subunit-like protein